MRVLAFSIFFLSTAVLNAQDIQISVLDSFEVELLDNLYGVSNSYGDIAIFYSWNEHNHIRVYNANGALKQTVDFRTTLNAHIRGLCFTKNILSIYYSYEKLGDVKEIRLFTMDVNTGNYDIQSRIKIKNSGKEKYIASINKFNTLFYLYYSENPDRIIVRSFTGDKKPTEQIFDSKIPDLGKHIQKLGLKYYSSVKDYNVDDGSRQGKFYLTESELTILYDGFDLRRKDDSLKTEIEILDLKNNQSTYAEIAGFGESVSCLLDSLLFKVSYNTTQFEMSVYSINPLKQRKRFTYSGTEEFGLMDGALTEIGYTTFYKHKNLDVHTTDQVLKELKIGIPTISAKLDISNNLKLMIGSFQVTVGPPIMYSSSAPYSVGGISRTTYSKEYLAKYFEFCLAPGSLDIIKDQSILNEKVQKSYCDQIYAITTEFTCNWLDHPDGKHVICFDKKSRLVKLIRLPEVDCEK